MGNELCNDTTELNDDEKSKYCNYNTILKEPKPTEENAELCNKYTELSKDVYNIIKSCSVSSSKLLLLPSDLYSPSSEFCNDCIELLQHTYTRWIEIFNKPDYLKIIYYLVVNGICYASGLVKVFGGDPYNTSKRLTILQKYGIIEEVADDEDLKKLYAHRQVFRIDPWHFTKARFYRLTKLGGVFYFETPFKDFIPSHMIKMADNWKQRLATAHKELEKEEFKIDKIKEGWYWSFCQRIKQGYGDFENHNWLDGRIESLAKKKGIIVRQSPSEMLANFVERYKLDRTRGRLSDE